jgi:omega-amidase
MNIACAQTAGTWENKAATHERVAALLEANPVSPGTMLILPEMFSTGFSMHVDAVAEERDGPTHRFLADQAVRWGIYVLGGVVTRAADGRGRNQAVLFSPDGREMLRYQKIHPFSLGGENEKYEAGCEIVTCEVEGFTVCPFICYDLRFPEIFRTGAHQRGATLFVVIAAWPRPRDMHWTTLLTARAIENQAYVAAVNHCGADPKLSYFGKSRIIDPKGETLAEAGAEPAVIQAAIEPAVVQNWRRDFPALRDIKRAGF